MPLLPPSDFAHVFEPFGRNKIGFLQLPGNVGDKLIESGTIELMSYYRLDYRYIKHSEMRRGELESDLDDILVSGGGNMGTMPYDDCYRLRGRALAFGKPVTILPQSFTNAEEDTSVYQRVFAREQASAAADPVCVLAPDMALGIRGTWLELVPRASHGVFLRGDKERLLPNDVHSLPDPALVCANPQEYIELASLFEHVYTDRLHFAIAALMANRRVTLLPNSYDKNRSMFETWLQDLGCEWRENLTGVTPMAKDTIEQCWRWLAGPPSLFERWSSRPHRPAGLSWKRIGKSYTLCDARGARLMDCDDVGRLVWGLCDGERTLEDITSLFIDAYPNETLAVAQGIQKTLSKFMECGATVGEPPRTKIRAPAREHDRLELVTRPTRESGGWRYLSCEVRRPGCRDRDLWFAVPARHAGLLTASADPFVLAMLMDAMSRGLPLTLSGGVVSSGLLSNLDRFQTEWTHWRTNLAYVPVEADEDRSTKRRSGAVAAFSGGLDSCFTVYMNRDPSSRELDLRAAVMIHGFDMPLSVARGFERAFARSGAICESAGVELLPLRTNFRTFQAEHWEERHATGLAASLAALQGGFGSGVISATMPRQMPSDWGSNPITDPMLGSDAMTIEHYGEHATRLDKFKAITEWPEALDNLRVCWQGWDHSVNCGTCRKCLMTQLTLRCLGAGRGCFETILDDRQLAAGIPAKYPGHMDRFDLLQLLEESEGRGIDAAWVVRLRDIYRKSR